MNGKVSYDKVHFVIPWKFHLDKTSVTLTGFVHVYTTDQPQSIKNVTEIVSTCLNQ